MLIVILTEGQSASEKIVIPRSPSGTIFPRLNYRWISSRRFHPERSVNSAKGSRRELLAPRTQNTVRNEKKRKKGWGDGLVTFDLPESQGLICYFTFIQLLRASLLPSLSFNCNFLWFNRYISHCVFIYLFSFSILTPYGGELRASHANIIIHDFQLHVRYGPLDSTPTLCETAEMQVCAQRACVTLAFWLHRSLRNCNKQGQRAPHSNMPQRGQSTFE